MVATGINCYNGCKWQLDNESNNGGNWTSLSVVVTGPGVNDKSHNWRTSLTSGRNWTMCLIGGRNWTGFIGGRNWTSVIGGDNWTKCLTRYVLLSK